jgi:hypothetical protein
MNAADFILNYWQQIVAVLAFVIWAVRLESKVNQLEFKSIAETKRLEDKFDTNESNRVIQRKEDMDSIHTSLRDIQSDVKLILKETRK